MSIDEVEKYFGTLYRACKTLGIVPQNMTQWKIKGYIPWVLQWRIEEITKGELKRDAIDPKIIAKQLKAKKELQ